MHICRHKLPFFLACSPLFSQCPYHDHHDLLSRLFRPDFPNLYKIRASSWGEKEREKKFKIIFKLSLGTSLLQNMWKENILHLRIYIDLVSTLHSQCTMFFLRKHDFWNQDGRGDTKQKNDSQRWRNKNQDWRDNNMATKTLP